MPTNNLLSEVMGEVISYGGMIVATRAEVYQDMISRGFPRCAADMFAFGSSRLFKSVCELAENPIGPYGPWMRLEEGKAQGLV